MLITWEHFHRVNSAFGQIKSDTYLRIWADLFSNFRLKETWFLLSCKRALETPRARLQFPSMRDSWLARRGDAHFPPLAVSGSSSGVILIVPLDARSLRSHLA